jgi:hypothetical protein
MAQLESQKVVDFGSLRSVSMREKGSGTVVPLLTGVYPDPGLKADKAGSASSLRPQRRRYPAFYV